MGRITEFGCGDTVEDGHDEYDPTCDVCIERNNSGEEDQRFSEGLRAAEDAMGQWRGWYGAPPKRTHCPCTATPESTESRHA